MSYTQSFRRLETKYLLTEQQTKQFLSAAENLFTKDKFGEYTICNLYLDTDDFYFIEHSLDHPAYKEKLRIRSYGNTSDENSNVFFEIKKKYRGVVYKRRIIVPVNQALDYIFHDIKPPCIDGYTANQTFAEIDWLMKKHRPTLKLYLAYDREAYYMTDNPSLRLTLDKNIRSRWENVTLKTDIGAELLDVGIDNYRLMEIKSGDAIPIELTKILSRLKAYPVSFSKYGRIYTSKHINNTRKELYI